MATWETQMRSFHEEPSSASVWSLKTSADSSAACTSAAMSDPLSKSLLTALNRRTSKNPSPSPLNDDSKLDTSYQNDSAGPAYGFAGRTTSMLHSADTKPEYNVTTSTAVATIPRGTAASAKSSSILNASASAGGASAKVSKKRARASRKPPTTVLEADSSNFRAMVQQLTGIPALPFLSTSLHQRNGLEFLDLVRPSSKSLLGYGGAQALQGLPPLDTSSLLLGRGQQHLQHSDTGFGPPPYFKYSMSAPQVHPRQTPSMGDFLRTPLDELGLDNSQQLLSSLEQQQQQQQQSPGRQQQSQQQHLQEKLDPSMPLLWDGNENSRELQQLEEISKYKLATSGTVSEVAAGDEIADHDGTSSRMARIVDSWLSHAEPGTDTTRSNNPL